MSTSIGSQVILYPGHQRWMRLEGSGILQAETRSIYFKLMFAVVLTCDTGKFGGDVSMEVQWEDRGLYALQGPEAVKVRGRGYGWSHVKIEEECSRQQER